ncbi:NADPH-dependent oxidoreductase [Nocardioides sp. S5]|uniref:flavodoxin family protein n=1 Tax=Nocardioides sp. S5 TaxID=2017486 RepID=UPI001A8C01E4|nr:NAD(P)H-dependent oxidoreductase [Nocardioides sp. S5]QSR29413.1 NADPH-dependent oxidoreductase [Nocardioides sp. S5]
MSESTANLSCLVLNCTLKPSPAGSSSELLGSQVLSAFAALGVRGAMERVVDHDVRFGVSADEGHGDAWPALRQQVLDADILVLVTPIWLGQPSSVAKMVLERLDAELSETDDEGRLLTFGKVAGVGVVGNEDGAHHVSAELFQALADVGFTVPAQAATYWVGEAMQAVDYKDVSPTPDTTAGTTQVLARHAAHLARLLRTAPYPAGD